MHDRYRIHDYGWMIADRVRTGSYAEALRKLIRPGAVVLDIGTGLGIWALFACRYGARKVYAIEASDAVLIAKQIAADNGFADRIEFIHGTSTQTALPQSVDIIVSDIHGLLPLYGQSIASIADARRRFLAPDGVLLPRRDTIWAALVGDDINDGQFLTIDTSTSWGFDLNAARRVESNSFVRAALPREKLLTEPQLWREINYCMVEAGPMEETLHWTVSRSGQVQGFVVWFDCDLADGISFSNAPGCTPNIFAQAFFPFPHLIPVLCGDVIDLDLAATPIRDDYFWNWKCHCSNSTAGQETVFHASTAFAEIHSLGQLQPMATEHIPTLNEDGQIDQFAIQQMDGTRSLGEIAAQLRDRFPHRFRDVQQSLDRACELSIRYSR